MCQVWFHAFSIKSYQGSQSQGDYCPVCQFFPSPHPLSSRKLNKSPKITFSSISPYSHNISFSPSSLHFRPDFSILPIVYLPPLNSGKILICVHLVCKSTYPFFIINLQIWSSKHGT